jgi:hypothetical protein
MWVDPPVDYPNFAADLDTPIADLEFDEISIASGGNNGDHYFWDAIEFAKGKPVVGGVFQSGFCPVADNSTGGPAGIIGFGSALAADNDLTLHVLGLPSDAFGVLLAARTTAIVPNPGGSLGTLCLGSDFGRGVGGVIWNSGSAGAATVVADLTAMPTSTGAVAVASGEQWILQAWYRDSVGGQAVSNLSELWGHTFQ